MNFPAVQYALKGFFQTFSRFPAALAMAGLSCVTAWVMVDLPHPIVVWTELLLSLQLGIALFYSLALANERGSFPKVFRPAYAFLAGLVFVGVFFYFLSGKSDFDYKDRYIHWLFMTLLFISFAPYLRSGETNGFWQFNKNLFIRLGVSSFYTGVLFLGISIALAAVDKLLGIKVEEKVYQYLWIFAGYFFWTTLFMGTTPVNYRELEDDKTYPKILKLFAQYALIPLVTVYFLILYAYMGKIVFTRQWPQGWVSWLTSTASVLGLVSFLLLYPAQEKEENRWIKIYSKGFCAAALPLLVMLFIAVFKRVEQYGMTEHRYFLIVLAAWLAGIFIYFIFGRKPDIKMVPVTLVLAAILSSFGPWGAYSVSLSSQLKRLESALERNGAVAGGKIIKLEKELDWKERQQLSASLDYVVRYHGVGPLKKYFIQDLASLEKKGKPWGSGYTAASVELMGHMGQSYLSYWERDDRKTVSFSSDKSVFSVRGFDLAFRFKAYPVQLVKPAPEKEYLVVLDKKDQAFKIFKGKTFKIGVPLKSLNGGLAARYPLSYNNNVPLEFMTLQAENGSLAAKICLERLSGKPKSGVKELEFNGGEGILLIREK
ncbi:MAG: hypothetical protein COT17_05555 [Elusimicrobia bacterium CG08_land_8_20_14_0_20_51_18]|nr:MAG: hypothetical protein COT17_05555 [Elusimicrobia bacterium CG08_land_8_20_14_0_20_51_18]